VKRRALVLAIMLAVVALCAGGVAAQDSYFLLAQPHGDVTVNHCVPHYTAKGRTEYDCYGDFTSDDGTVKATNVSFPSHGFINSGDRERVTVSGPDATLANPIGYVHIVIFGGVALAAVLGLLVMLLRRLLGRPTGGG